MLRLLSDDKQHEKIQTPAERVYNHHLADQRLNTQNATHFFTTEVPQILISFIRPGLESQKYIVVMYDVLSQTEFHYKRENDKYHLCYSGTIFDPRNQDNKQLDNILISESPNGTSCIRIRTIDIQQLSEQKHMELDILYTISQRMRILKHNIILSANLHRGISTDNNREKALELTHQSIKYISDQWTLINPRNLPMKLSYVNAPPDSWQLQIIEGDRLITVLIFVPNHIKFTTYTNEQFKELQLQVQNMKLEIKSLKNQLECKQQETKYESKMFSENGKMVLCLNGESYVPLFRQYVMDVANLSYKDATNVINSIMRPKRKLNEEKYKKYGKFKIISSWDVFGGSHKAREISKAFGLEKTRSEYYLMRTADFKNIITNYMKK